jgi:hypothetical protein
MAIEPEFWKHQAEDVNGKSRLKGGYRAITNHHWGVLTRLHSMTIVFISSTISQSIQNREDGDEVKDVVHSTEWTTDIVNAD